MANLYSADYQRLQDYVLIEDFFLGHAHIEADGQIHRTLTFKFLVNELLMPFFFALAGKEIFEAVALKNGRLRGKKALVPLICTVGGMAGPISVYLLIGMILGPETYATTFNGWAIPAATDIAFAAMAMSLALGKKHVAYGFLLLLAVADDALSLAIMAYFFPQGELRPEWLLVSAGAAVTVWTLFNYLPRKACFPVRFWPVIRSVPYAVAAFVSLYAFQEAGLHTVLGFLPVVLAIPHADSDAYVMFDDSEASKSDLLNYMEHHLKGFVEVILGLFGFMNAGVLLSTMGPATVQVLLGLLIGKVVGIMLFGWLSEKLFGLTLPDGMTYRTLAVVGMAAAVGFTVALFFATVALPIGETQDAAKMGALLSFVALPLAWLLARLLKVESAA